MAEEHKGENMSESTSNKSAERRYEVVKKDLPLCCPLPSMSAWDAHPRVFLDIAQKGEILCPYCGALYVLVDARA
jgi:uncharacterized Zn-finger protein